MKFQRPTGAAADVSELEFVSALHQVSLHYTCGTVSECLTIVT